MGTRRNDGPLEDGAWHDGQIHVQQRLPASRDHDILDGPGIVAGPRGEHCVSPSRYVPDLVVAIDTRYVVESGPDDGYVHTYQQKRTRFHYSVEPRGFLGEVEVHAVGHVPSRHSDIEARVGEESVLGSCHDVDSFWDVG